MHDRQIYSIVRTSLGLSKMINLISRSMAVFQFEFYLPKYKGVLNMDDSL